VVLSVLAMKYDRPANDIEPYNRMVLDGMRWSRTKVDAIRASMLPEEDFASYVLPLLRFHNRWSELDRGDFRYFFTRRQVSIAGFLMRSDVRPAGWIPYPYLLPNYDFGDTAWEYLEKIAYLCEQNGIQLVLYKAPSLTPHWYEQWDEQIAQYARERGLAYLNALDKIDEIGLDYQQDTFNGGLHLNRQGAEKMARYLGGYLQENCPALTDRRGEPSFDRDWAVKCAQYYAMQAAQEREIAETGKVETLLVPEIDPNNPVPKPTGGTGVQREIYFAPNGVRIDLGAPAEPILEALGEPLRFVEDPSYAHQEIDNTRYRYEGFDLTVIYPKQGSPLIADIKLTNDMYSIPGGITLGSTLEDVLAAYGTQDRKEHGFYYYTQDKSTLRIAIQDGMVVQILMDYALFD
jgi:hypothetical protein